MINAENEILGNIKCLLMPGCLLLISLLMPGSTVLSKYILRSDNCYEIGNHFSDLWPKTGSLRGLRP